jgi:hypothetical protein
VRPRDIRVHWRDSKPLLPMLVKQRGPRFGRGRGKAERSRQWYERFHDGHDLKPWWVEFQRIKISADERPKSWMLPPYPPL